MCIRDSSYFKFAKVFSAKFVPKIAKSEKCCQIFRIFFDTRKLMPAKISVLKLMLQNNSKLPFKFHGTVLYVLLCFLRTLFVQLYCSCKPWTSQLFCNAQNPFLNLTFKHELGNWKTKQNNITLKSVISYDLNVKTFNLS